MKNVIIFGIDNSLSSHIDNKTRRYFRSWGRLPLGLDDIAKTVEVKYFFNFTVSKKKFYKISLLYNGSIIFCMLIM